MTKEQRAVVLEYIAGLSDETIRTMTAKLIERIEGDLAEALDFMSRNTKMDAMFASAKSANDLYDLADQVRDMLMKECKRKGIVPSVFTFGE